MLLSIGGEADVGPEDEWCPEGKERGEVAGAAYINPPPAPSGSPRDPFQATPGSVSGEESTCPWRVNDARSLKQALGC